MLVKSKRKILNYLKGNWTLERLMKKKRGSVIQVCLRMMIQFRSNTKGWKKISRKIKAYLKGLLNYTLKSLKIHPKMMMMQSLIIRAQKSWFRN